MGNTLIVTTGNTELVSELVGGCHAQEMFLRDREERY